MDGSRFENVSTFQHDGLICLLFSFEGVKLDMGRLAMWRLQTHEQFGGTWLSDFVPNRLGEFVREQRRQKPKMELSIPAESRTFQKSQKKGKHLHER